MSVEADTQSKRGAVVLDDNEVALAGPDFDQPPSPLKRFVVVAATGRSGSHMRQAYEEKFGLATPMPEL